MANQIGTLFRSQSGKRATTGIKFLRLETKVFGVEPVDVASMKGAIEAGERIVLDRVGLFVDDVAVRQAGDENISCPPRSARQCAAARGYGAICAVVKDIFEDMRVFAEPVGALLIVGLKTYTALHLRRSDALITINSGANINFDRLQHVVERVEIRADHIHLSSTRFRVHKGQVDQCRKIESLSNANTLINR